jgi:superfamily II DNA helicase RecQ
MQIAYTADLSMDERGDVQKAFNEEKEKAMISSAPSA